MFLNHTLIKKLTGYFVKKINNYLVLIIICLYLIGSKTTFQ